MWRLDDHYLELEYEMPILTKRPSAYVDDQISFTTQPLGSPTGNPEHTAWTSEMAGPNNIMFSSDLPHSDFDPPEELYDRIGPHLNDCQFVTFDEVLHSRGHTVFHPGRRFIVCHGHPREDATRV